MDTFSTVCPSVRYGIDPLGFALPLPRIVLSVAIANFALAEATAAAAATSLRKFRLSMTYSVFSHWQEEKRSGYEDMRATIILYAYWLLCLLAGQHSRTSLLIGSESPALDLTNPVSVPSSSVLERL